MGGPTWGHRLMDGALAGVAGGLLSAVLLWLAVEPSIHRAIALEEAAAAAAAGAAGHEHGEVVSRLGQQIGGTVTVVVVAVLLALVYAVVYARAADRMLGSTALGRSASLAALAFTVLALLPALLLPANPPAVGDPGTVDQRTLLYLQVVLLGVLVVGAVFAVHRALTLRPVAVEWRWLATAGAVLVGVAVVLLATPDVEQPIPAEVPAALIWEFRVGSLAQLAALWAGIGVVHGALAHRTSVRLLPSPQRVPL